MQIADIETLLVGSVLRHQSPNVWKGDYVRSFIDVFLNRLSHNKGQRTTDTEFAKHLQSYDFESVKSTLCWVTSGCEVPCFELATPHLLSKIYFEPNKIVLQVEFIGFKINKIEYDMSDVSASTLLSGLIESDSSVEKLCCEWPLLVKKCTQRARLIELTYAATNSYLSVETANTPLKYHIDMNAACIAVEITIEGLCSKTTSIVAGDNPTDKLSELISEMKNRVVDTTIY